MLRTVINQTIRKLSAMSSSIKCRRLDGKVAIVTGSTDGIGLSIAKRLAQEGAKVVISSRKEANVKSAVEQLKNEGLQVSGITCHVGKAEDRKKLFEKAKTDFGGLDILISNVAVSPAIGTILNTTEEVWDKAFDINVKSMYLLMQESLPLLRCSKSPCIVLISSITAYNPMNLIGVYSLTKTTLLGLTKSIAEELAPEGIRVNCVAPGIIKTKFSKMLYEDEAIREIALQNINMRRLGKPEEIASATAFLASEDASYITGETLIVAGGMKARL